MADYRPNILVVDDQRSMRLTLSGIIEDQGCDVTEVEDGYQAVEAASKTRFDLVFMDIKMPGMDGVQTFREIKRIRPGSLVVMMTGFAVDDMIKEALEEGAVSVLYKPFEIERVISLVRSVLRTGLILVVDDRAADRATLSQVLADEGYVMAEAPDGEEAIRMIESIHYDIILMDIRLPGKDGFASFRAIREIDPEARVIFMTGFSLDDSMRQELQVGAYPIAYKPFDMDDVLALVRRVAVEGAR